MATLFLAYTPADRQPALTLADGLRAAAHQVHTAPDPAGDAGWWSAVLDRIQIADAFLYATPGGGSAAGAGSMVVARERTYAEALGIPTLEIHLSGAGPATGVDLRAPSADAAFGLIGAIASLPARRPAAGRPPESPFAGVAHLIDDMLAEARTPPGPRASAGPAGFSKWAPPGTLTAEDVHHAGFRKPALGHRGYDEESVDRFLDQVESDLRTRQAGGPVIRVALTAADVHAMKFLRPPFGRRGYDEEQVDHFLDEVRRTFAALDRDLAARGATVAKA